MEVWGFLSKNITTKPASYFIYNSLAALVLGIAKLKISAEVCEIKLAWHSVVLQHDNPCSATACSKGSSYIVNG